MIIPGWRRPAVLLCALMLMVTGCAGSDPVAGGSPTTLGPTTTSAAVPPPSPRPPKSVSPRARPRPVKVTVVMNGDLLWHNTLWYGAQEDARREGRRGYDFAPLLAGIKPVVAGADLAICHQEVPLGRRGGPYRNYPLFSVPPQVVRAIKTTGYDACTTASNHSLDRGFGGLKRTLQAFDRAKITHAGSARTRREAERPVILTTRQGVKIAIVAGTFSLNGIPPLPGKPWAVARLDAQSMLRRARQARRAGADIVIVAAHAGTEYATRENSQQRQLAKALTASADVDLVYMHHAHVVQPWTKINGKWVIYGLGNAVAQHAPQQARGYEGVTARMTFTRVGTGRFSVTRAEYIPTLVTRYRPGRPARLHHVAAALRTAKGSFRNRLLTARHRTSVVVTRHHPPGLTRS